MLDSRNNKINVISPSETQRATGTRGKWIREKSQKVLTSRSFSAFLSLSLLFASMATYRAKGNEHISIKNLQIMKSYSGKIKGERFGSLKPSSFTSFTIKNILDFVVTGKTTLIISS